MTVPPKPESAAILESVITCPRWATRTLETMPMNACQYFYDCPGCGAVLRPNPGDCCVFCSFGSIPRPPIQEGRDAPDCCA